MEVFFKSKWLLLAVLLFSVMLISAPVIAVEVEEQDNAVATNLGLYGSYTWDIAVDPMDNNNIYLATYYSPNGLFFSTDGGNKWSGLPVASDHGAGHSVEVNPTSGAVYALLEELLISYDNFETYEVVEAFTGSGSDMLYANNALYIAANDQVYRTDDDGTTFSQATVCENETIWSIASSPNKLFAVCYNYDTQVSSLYETLDEGTTWTDLNIAGDGIAGAEKVEVNPVTNSVYLIPSSTGGATYKSTDNGFTWTELTTAPLTGNMSFDSTGRIYVGWYYSDDDGTTWINFGGSGDYNHIIFVDPTNDEILYDTSSPGFSKSTDAGVTWTNSVENITGVEVTDMSQTTDKDTVWVATQNGPAKTTNFTSNDPEWAYVEMQNFTSSGYDAVWVDPADPDTAVYSSSMQLSYTTDGGTTWTNSTVDITLTGAVFQIVNDSEGNLYGAVGPNTSAGSQTGDVIMSTDNGATWNGLGITDNVAVRSVAVDSAGDVYAGAHSSAGGIYKYDGNSWTKVNAPDEFEYRAIVINPDSDDNIYALATGDPGEDNTGFYMSMDGGNTWTKSNSGLGGSNNYTEFNALTLQGSTNTFYLAGVDSSTRKGVIYKSKDAGDSWDLYYTGKKSEVFNVLLFDGLLAGNSRGLFDMKSLATLKLKANKTKIKKNKKAKITITLKDKTTGKKLKNKRIKLYREIGKKDKKYWKTIKLNKKGKKVIKFYPKKQTMIYAKWKMNSVNREEYISPGVKEKLIKIKK